MIRPISFSLFADFLLARGGARFTAAKSHVSAEPQDVYAAFKAMAARVATGDVDAFTRLLAGMATDDRRVSLYPGLVGGFLRFMRKTHLVGCAAPFAAWSPAPATGIDIAVNPELAGTIGGVGYVIKLHCRKEPCDRARAEAMIGIMEAALRSAPGVKPSTVFAVLDVRTGKLHTVASAAVLAREAKVAVAEMPAYAALRFDAARAARAAA